MHNVIMQMETCFGCEAPELHGVSPGEAATGERLRSEARG